MKVDGEYTHARPARTARAVAQWLRGCEAARILDYGSGAGIFAHCMRQAGFAHIESYDPFSSPARPSGAFDIVTCFEVIEHSPDPVATLADMRQFLRADGCILFGQTTQPADILARRGSWWYIAPRNGHVSTFSEESLAVLGQRQGLTLHKGADMYGYAPLYPSSFARVALAAIGPSLATVRLLAPAGLLTSGWHFPSRADTVWHQQGDDGVWRHCWTGAAHMQWQASWQPADRLQIRLPYISEVTPGFAAECRFEYAGQTLPARLDRGELVVEMPTHGATSGTISLHTPTPLDPHAGQGGPPGPHGLAVPVSLEPCTPAHLRAAA